MRTAIIFITIFLLPAIAFSATIIVPDDYRTIQQAIDAAVNGDTVLVKPGTYVENIDFLSKNLVLKSAHGAMVTVIDGGDNGSVVTMAKNLKPYAILEGFTIQHGKNYDGGGIACYWSSPTIRYNIIIGNLAGGSSTSRGGGIYCIGSPMIKGNYIVGNVVWGNGAYPFTAGGGIATEYNFSNPLIEDNVIRGNKVVLDGAGGGIYLDGGDSTRIVNNIITLNEGYDSGGGIDFAQGGMYLALNNTIYENTAGVGGGVTIGYGSHVVTMSNTILYGNSAKDGAQIFMSTSSVLEINHSDVQGGQPGVYVWPGAQLNWGPGMILDNPLFVDSANGDFHLTYPSLCKDTGDNTAVTELFDFEGDPRIAYGTVDMGADEFYTHLYWTGDATPGGNVEIKFVGLPGTSPVGLCIGTGVLDPPIPSMWGDWYLKFPIFGPMNFGQITSPEGVLIVPATIPGTPPPPYSIPMQALIGAELSNLSVLKVK